MVDAEKLEILQQLQAGRDAVADAIAGVDHALATRKNSGRWSVLDCGEHIAESERHLLLRLEEATFAEKPFEKSRREAKIAMLAADRTRKIDAPKPVLP